MRIGDRLQSLSPREVSLEHVADDRAGPNDRDLDDDVIKSTRLRLWQECDLGAALDLKHPDRVGVLQRLVNLRVIMRDLVEIEIFAVMFTNERDRVTQHGHHSQTKQVDLDYL